MSYETLGAGTLPVQENQQTKPGYLPDSVVELAAEQHYVDRPQADTMPLLVCGDDRNIAPLSVKALHTKDQRIINPNEGSIGLFGQHMGLVHAVTIAILASARNEDEAIRLYSNLGSVHGISTLLIDHMDIDTSPLSVVPALHSDEKNEGLAFSEQQDLEVKATNIPANILAARGFVVVTNGNQQEQLFRPDGTAPTGCAYNMNFGLVSKLVATDQETQSVFSRDTEVVMGSARHTEQIIKASALMDQLLNSADVAGSDSDKKDTYVFGRKEYVDSRLPVVVLEGAHAKAAKTGILFNTDPTKLSLPGKFYREDIAGSTLVIKRALRMLNLGTRLLMETMVAHATPPRTVLAMHDRSGDTTPDPRRLAVGVVGGRGEDAITEINQLAYAR